MLIAIEGVYSMDGDYPDLARFVDIKKKHHAMLLRRRGALARNDGQRPAAASASTPASHRSDVDLWMGTLSKSLASCGGYIAGSAELIEYLKYTAPGFVYSVGISPPNAATALAALTLLQREPQRVARLHELSASSSRSPANAGSTRGSPAGTPVIPIIVGNSVRCLLLSRALFRRGINVQPIIHPAVPEQRHAAAGIHHDQSHRSRSIRDAVDAIVEELAKL